MEQAKAEARRRNEPLTSLLEQGLRLVLAQKPKSSRRPKVMLPVCRAGGGTFPRVNLDSTAALEDRMNDRASFRPRR
jgi:hypothetical protein